MAGEHSGAGLLVDGGQWDSLRPFGEPVNNGEQVGVSLGQWKRSHKVDEDMVEPLWRDGERPQGGSDVVVHFCAFAVKAGLGLGPDLL